MNDIIVGNCILLESSCSKWLVLSRMGATDSTTRIAPKEHAKREKVHQIILIIMAGKEKLKQTIKDLSALRTCIYHLKIR